MLKTKRTILNFKKLLNKYEYIKKLNKFIYVYLNNSLYNTYLSKNYFYYKKRIPKISKTKIKSICLLTNRTRSVNKFYSISRINLREMLSFGIIPGYKKAIW